MYGDNVKCCGNCEYGQYDPMQGYVCVNADSEYVADFVEYEYCCEEFEKKECKHEDNN